MLDHTELLGPRLRSLLTGMGYSIFFYLKKIRAHVLSLVKSFKTLNYELILKILISKEIKPFRWAPKSNMSLKHFSSQPNEQVGSGSKSNS